MLSLDLRGGHFLIAIEITFLIFILASGIGATSEVEIAYDDGTSEGDMSIGSVYSLSDWQNGGKAGHAVRFSPGSNFFMIDTIKVFGKRYGEDYKMRIEIWDQNKSIIYQNISNHSDYFTTNNQWAYI